MNFFTSRGKKSPEIGDEFFTSRGKRSNDLGDEFFTSRGKKSDIGDEFFTSRGKKSMLENTYHLEYQPTSDIAYKRSLPAIAPHVMCQCYEENPDFYRIVDRYRPIL